MKSRLLAGVLLATSFVWVQSAVAAEPYLEFVKELRNSGFYDYAILYLDQVGGKANTPAEIKAVIPYEKAMTLLAGSKSERSPEKRIAQLDQAQGFLEQFVSENPNHPAAAEANSDRAQILLDKGRAEVLQSKSPSNQGTKKSYQERARGLISKARQVFQTAYDQHDANVKKFPAFIDKSKEPEQAAARAKVETNLITASLNLGMCTYEEAQTYEPSSNEFKTLLNNAAEEFEKMHQKYRSQVGGLYARAWQGKCYEEQKDYQKALGLYNELLGHQGEDAALSALKTQTLYFKVICLNTKDRHDYQLVVDLVDEWVKKHQNETRTNLGLGLQWEQALAFESLADDRSLLKQDQERFWRQARTVALVIQKFPSEYRDAATAMIQRLTVKLGGPQKDAKDFATANSMASGSVKLSQDIKKDLDDAMKRGNKEEIDKLKLDYAQELNSALRNFELAFSLIKRDDDKKEIMTARLFYAYTNFWLRKNYEAAVLAEYVARTADKNDSTLALDAAYLTMAAFVQAFADNKAPIDQKGEDMQLIIKACNRIAERWPSSEKANEAYMILGRMYSAQKKPADSATWFGKVPPSDSKFPEAQINAGQAFWTAYLNSARVVGPDKKSPEQLASWLKAAQDHLRSGIDALSKTVPKDAAPSDLIAAKMSLSQILISQGKDAEAAKLLLDDPQSVIKAITVADETARPDTGITSRKFAIECYKLLLRSYIGTGNLDKARETMKKLEEIAAAGGTGVGADVTELYISLGKQLKDELERLRNNQENERFENLMKSFETFLNDMASRKDGQTFGSLSWIGETYFALGETIADPGKAMAFFEKAGNAFAEILNRANTESSFATPLQLYGVKLRQVRVHRLKKEFEKAEALIGEVLKQSPNQLTPQIAASELYQDWGSSGQANGSKKLAIAIKGEPSIQAWGWGQIAVKVQKSSEFGTNPVYLQHFLDARYSGTKCRQLIARDLDPKKKQKQLESCLSELVATVAVVKELTDEQYAKLNELYREILVELGRKPEDLRRSKEVAAAPPTPEKPMQDAATAAAAAGSKAEATPKTAEPAAPTGPQPIDMMTWIMFGACLVFGLAAVGWVLLKGKAAPKTKSFGTATAAGPVSFAGFSGGEVLPPATFAAPKPKPRPAGAPPAGTKPAAKPAPKAPPAAPAGAVAPKPKPKPPAPPAG